MRPTSSTERNGWPKCWSTCRISVKRGSERYKGRQRLKIEWATCRTPLFTLTSSVASRATRSCHMRRYGSPDKNTDLHKSIPLLPKVAVCYHAHGISQLCLQIGWHSYHQSNQLLLNGTDIFGRQLVLPIFVLDSSSAFCCRGSCRCNTVQLRLM